MKFRKDSKIEIIAVGSELLTPFYQDTDSLYITQRLNDMGVAINFKSIVGDSPEDLATCFNTALARSDLVFIIGGLGPTEDDRTREVLASILGKTLIFKEEILEKIKSRFQRRGMEMPSVNKKQAYVIEGASVLENEHGTAPGLWLGRKGKVLILLPGPPHEMRPMFESAVWPRIQSAQSLFMARQVIKTTGLTESEIETRLSDIYPLPSAIQLTTLAYPGQIELHLTSQSLESTKKASAALSELGKKIRKRLGDHIFSSSGDELEEVTGRLLRRVKKTIAIAESCTGGLLGHRITNVPGSSDYFSQGVQAYSNESKIQMLGIQADLIHTYGAVSQEVARAMAQGIRERSGADIALSITGIAGPAGGSPEKPVGLVYTAIAFDGGVDVVKNVFLGDRAMVKSQSAQKALDMLRRHLLQYKKK